MSDRMKELRQGIEGIRSALGRNPQAPLDPRPEIYPAYPPKDVEQAAADFLTEIAKLSGVGKQLTPANLAAELAALVSENKIRKATVWHSAWFEELGIENSLRSLGVELVSPNADKLEMAECDLGITSADYLLPETGTLVLRSSTEKPRAVSLLPRIHLAIVRPEMLRPDLHQVFAEARNSHYLVFITGPSRTADIELTTTLGVHGPKNLFVWMLPTNGEILNETTG